MLPYPQGEKTQKRSMQAKNEKKGKKKEEGVAA